MKDIEASDDLLRSSFSGEENNKKDGGSCVDSIQSSLSLPKSSPRIHSISPHRPTFKKDIETDDDSVLSSDSCPDSISPKMSSNSMKSHRRVTRKKRKTKPYKWSATTKKKMKSKKKDVGSFVDSVQSSPSRPTFKKDFETGPSSRWSSFSSRRVTRKKRKTKSYKSATTKKKSQADIPMPRGLCF